METYRFLEKALALIEDKKDWCQYLVEDEQGRHCAVGALDAVALATKATRKDAWAALSIEVELATDGAHGAVSAFNDSRSHAEVVALFKKTIASEKAKAGALLEVPSNCSETQRVYA